MTVTEWMQAHRRSILFLLALLVAGGLASALKLPVALFPQVDFPRIDVTLDAGDRPADQMALQVTWPVEEAIRAVPGVVNIRSTTTRGSADISTMFEWGQDMVAKLLLVESAINQTLSQLPQGTTFEARRMDPTVFPVLAYSMTSDTRSLVELRDIALYQLRPLLSTVKGVAKVGVQGGDREEYRVTVDPAKLASFHLSLDDVAKALSAANIITAVGRLEDHYKLYLVVSDTRFTDLASIGQTAIRSGKDGVVLVEDVATVTRAIAPRWNKVTADGHAAVLFQIYQQPGGNTVEIDRQLKAKLAQYRSHLPADVHIANWYDQSELILSSATSVRDAILIGVVLAALVLLIFLRSLKITLIAIISVPSVIAATVLLLHVLHMSFNIMTLGGMAAAVGLIIDDTIVMVEHIMRRLRSGSGDHRRLVMRAAREFTQPLIGSSASTIIIFVPLAFLSGVTGAFFKSLSLTMAAALFISFFVAWLAEPLIADHILSAKDAAKEEGGALTRYAHRGYDWLMVRLLRRRGLVLVIIVPLVLFGWVGYIHVGSGFMPSMDEGGFILDYRTPPGTSLTETNRLLNQVGAILRQTPAVATYSRRTGLALGGTLSEANEGDFFVRLKPSGRPPIWTVMDNVRAKIEHTVPGIHIEMAQLMEDLIGDLTAVPQPIEIKIYSDNGALLGRLGPKVAAAIQNVPGVVEVDDGVVLAGDALDIKIDRVKASLEGVDPESVTNTLQKILSGSVTTQVQQGPKMVGVRLWVPDSERETIRDVRHLQLRAPDGHLFPVERIATIRMLTGQPQIDRDDLKRMIAVTGRISGRDMGSVIRQIKAVLNQPGLLPSTVYYTLGGLYRQQQIAFTGLATVFVAAVLLVFFLLLFLYESFRMAVSILVTTLISTSAVFIGLWMTAAELNIMSMMGLTMIVGIVTEVGIFYASEYHDLPVGGDADTYILAGKNRMRPIAMTTVATILALLPLALGIGRGSAMQQPLAIAIISGLVAQFPLVLIVLPVLLSLLRYEKRTEEGGEKSESARQG
jgi:CzcA family heavy metal efflux pump